jgi:SNF2 family DNA or RNA helicase
MEYSKFIENKTKYTINTGFDVKDEELNENLFDFQRAIVKWGLKKGKCAFFEDTGLGKTIQLLSFSQAVYEHEKKMTGGAR